MQQQQCRATRTEREREGVNEKEIEKLRKIHKNGKRKPRQQLILFARSHFISSQQDDVYLDAHKNNENLFERRLEHRVLLGY